LAKKVAEEKKRQELAKKAAEETKRQALAKKASAEKKRKADEKHTADNKKTSPNNGSGTLEQQLAVLKKLHSNGLINEQEFKTKKETLLSRFLGLKSTPSTKVAEEQKPPELPKRAAEQKSELPKTSKKPAKW
jgi:hypothetical protein